MNQKRIFLALTLSFVVTGSAMVAHAAYFYAKGSVTQYLLNTAWKKSRQSGRPVAPWGLATSLPVAKLTIDSIGLSRVVLNNADSGSLAVGPGHIGGTSLPGSEGNIVIAAHRDSFFRGLRRIQRGDLIELESLDALQYFRVAGIAIAKPEDTYWVEHTKETVITLITCYPFDYIGPAPERYVVRGRLTEKKASSVSRG